MNGLGISRKYFFSVAESKLKCDFPDLYPRLAAGLVGNGSECYGFDDELSRDHDWGIDFFIWTTDSDKASLPALSEWKLKLFEEYPPEFKRTQTEYGARIGVMTCEEFYASLLGVPGCPQTLNEWLRAPEENFSLAVNGDVFYDGYGAFSKIRERLLGYYPEDLRRKKLSARCMALAQTGQYNHERIAQRNDPVTLRTVLASFSDNAIAMVFLLNRVFRPYYKWAFRASTELPILGNDAARLLRLLAETGGLDGESVRQQQEYISQLCALFVQELRSQGLTRSDDSFLTTHGEEIRSGIMDEFLRSLPAQYEL